MQNIPSHNKDIRKMFKATDGIEYIVENDNVFEVDRWCEVKTVDGWLYADKVKVGDMLEVEDNGIFTIIVRKIDKPVNNNHILLYYE